VFATYDEDTIAAIATPAGEGGIGIIRLSGQCALAIADELFAGSRRQSLLAVPNFSLHHGYIVHLRGYDT
jgi:tRNA modification GTPase